jgi:hypothetical protein
VNNEKKRPNSKRELRVVEMERGSLGHEVNVPLSAHAHRNDKGLSDYASGKRRKARDLQQTVKIAVSTHSRPGLKNKNHHDNKLGRGCFVWLAFLQFKLQTQAKTERSASRLGLSESQEDADSASC